MPSVTKEERKLAGSLRALRSIEEPARKKAPSPEVTLDSATLFSAISKAERNDAGLNAGVEDTCAGVAYVATGA